MHVTNSKFARGRGSHNINLLTPIGRRPVDIRLVKIVYLCIHCLGKLKSHNSGVQCELNSNHYGYIHRDEAKELTQEERFMKLSDMFPSEYFRGIDIGKPIIVTISAVIAEQAKNFMTGEAKTEWVMKFHETPKKLRLNLTMVKACALFLESTENPEEIDPENWVGKKVTIYRTMTKVKKEEHLVPRIRRPERGDVDLAKAIQQAKNGSKPTNGGPTFDDLLKKLSDELGLDESTAKSLLKDELGFKSYKASEFQKMFDSVQAIVPKQAALSDEFDIEELAGFAPYSEDT